MISQYEDDSQETLSFKKTRAYQRFNALRFFEEATFLEDGVHFIPIVKEDDDGCKHPLYSMRNLNNYGFKRNSNLSVLHNCPVLFYIYKDENGLPIFRKNAQKNRIRKLIKRGGPPVLESGDQARQIGNQLSISPPVKTEVNVLIDKMVQSKNLDPSLADQYYLILKNQNGHLEKLTQLHFLFKKDKENNLERQGIPKEFLDSLKQYLDTIHLETPDPSLSPRYLSFTKSDPRHPVIDYWDPLSIRVGEQTELEMHGENLDDGTLVVLFNGRYGEIIFTRERKFGERIKVLSPSFPEPTDVKLEIYYFIGGVMYQNEHPDLIPCN
eukprot:TRINITY_DN6790_c0_g1_i1.p1 TRINITY_DN6790_c0_g1~~TRINITY_DN6790_c0_g1_i1.p1  ORF type:complete len:340 (-),score=53.30 TRINITY_DN6790_c0_g1_i1:64-1038(-)